MPTFYETDELCIRLIALGLMDVNGNITAPLAAAVQVRSADPTNPVNGTFWVVSEGVSPAATLSVKARMGGVTYTIGSIAY